MRYKNSVNTSTPSVNGTWVNYGTDGSSTADSNICPTETTFGEIIMSGAVMRFQKSCEPHAYNAGNYYNFPAASAKSSDPTPNSVCSKGWILPDNNGNTSYSNLLIAYGIDNNATKVANTHDAALINLPLSFLRPGFYSNDGTLHYQGSYGLYRMTSHNLYFHSNGLVPAYDTSASVGYSVRCVGR